MSVSNIKIVNIGDSGVGKTCVLISFVDNEFPQDHVPTAFDNYTSVVEGANGEAYSLALWDTSGQDNDTMRPLSYNDAKVVIVFFSLVDRKSFEKLEKFWIPEIQKHAKDVPYIIVGNKLDLRNDDDAVKKLGVKPITTDEGKAMTKKIGGISYRECSAKTQEGLGEVFQAAIAAVVAPESLEFYSKETAKKSGIFGKLFGKK